jgi:hypothetical protein
MTSIIELTGITGSGKTTFITKLKKLSKDSNYNIAFVNEYGIHSISSRYTHKLFFFNNPNDKKSLIRSFLTDLTLLPYFFKTKNLKLSVLFLKNIFLSKENFFIKLNIFRNFIKKLGMFYKLNRLKVASDLDFIFIDEGSLHITHNIFVNEQIEPNYTHFDEFMSLVPLYDFILLLSSTKEKLLSVLSKRKHNRASSDIVSQNNYISNAMTVFEWILKDNRANHKIINVDNNSLNSVQNFNSLITKLSAN